jgi:hypothetical protein
LHFELAKWTVHCLTTRQEATKKGGDVLQCKEK